MQITITLPESFEVSKRNGATVTVDTSKLNAESVAVGALMGMAEKVRNSTAETAGPDEDAVTMQETVDRALYAGEWNIRGTGPTTDPLDEFRIKAARLFMKRSEGAALKAAHDDIDGTKERRAFLVEACKATDWMEEEAAQLKADQDRAFERLSKKKTVNIPDVA